MVDGAPCHPASTQRHAPCLPQDEDSEWLSWAPYNGQAPTSFPPRAVGPAAPPSRSPSVIKRDASMATSHVLEAIAVPAVVLCSSIATSVLIFPFFTYVPSSGHMAEFLPQVVHVRAALCDAQTLVPWSSVEAPPDALPQATRPPHSACLQPA